jgi:glycosidase
MKKITLTSICLLWFLGASAQAQNPYAIESRLSASPGFQYHPSPADWRDVNMYQLFTDRFSDGNSGNNLSRYSTQGVPWYNQTGSNAENDRHLFQGGDWAGIKQKLDYLQGMGVNCIWISGVQLNEQGLDKRFTPYHAYHPSDFYQVEPMFGTFAELKDLIDTAHSRGIYVMIDVVVNHTADLLKYTDCNCNYEGYCEFNCAGLAWWNNSIKVGWPFDDPQWFHNNGNIGDNDWDTYPRYINGAFLGTEDLKTELPYVQNALKDIFKHLIDATDCDGFRVDAIKHMDYNFIKDWAHVMRQHAAFRGKSNFLLFGEYFSYDDATQASYCKDVGYSFNSTLWFPMQLTMKNVFAFEQGTGQLGSRMNALSQYGEAADKVVAFMDNHDVDRIALECGSQWESKMRPGLTFLYTATPVPCLFYGTEHGFNQGDRRNGSPKLGQADFQRECMMNFGFQWGNAYGDKFFASPLYQHIKKLNELRGQYECLRRGAYSERWQEGGAGLFAFTRTTASQDALVVINTAWNNKSANPNVNRPDGTVYENKLNPGETATVSGGKLSVSLNGKESKIYIAGQGQAQVETSCDANTLTITYRPQSGPLASPAGSIYIVISHDGGQDPLDTAMTPVGADWTHAYSLAAQPTNVVFSFHDQGAPAKVDNNGGQNWAMDVSGCGDLAVDLGWIGNTHHWPPTGEWDPGEDLWVNIESWPKAAVAEGSVVYSADGGANWLVKPLNFNGETGNNDRWHANLGSHPAQTLVKYAVSVTGRNGTLWDNNGGADFSNRVNAGSAGLTLLTNVYHWPGNGFIVAGDDLWINIESQPVGAGMGGEVVWSTNGGASWQTAPLAANGVIDNRDGWHANLGGFPPLATIRYAVKVTDGNALDHWANNGGHDYIAQVNPASSSLRWFGNTVNAGVPPPQLDIGPWAGHGKPGLGIGPLATGGIYSIHKSVDLHTWSNLTTFVAGSTDYEMELYPEATPADERAFFTIVPNWAPGRPVYEDNEVIISIETWPIGGATGANLVYSDDGGAHWHVRSMTHGGTRGNNDIWTAHLGFYPKGTLIQYAIEVLDDQGGSHWANNDNQDFHFAVYDPNQTDFNPPTTSHSPAQTITANPTLDVTLTAVDDLDPAPVIHFTTNGSEPTPASPVYSGPIHVTDQGGGVDMVIKYFARDNAGNSSAVKTIEVKVNQTFAFGGNRPYSTNPTLGQPVANGSITVNGVNNGEWTTNNLIALDLANDDPRTLGGNDTYHEAPADLTHLWAAWDDNNLYLAWQFVDVTDKLPTSPDNANSALNGRVSNSQGILQFISLDTIPGQGAVSNMWSKNDLMDGPHKPDYQIGLRSDLYSSYISRAVNGVFPVDDGGINYFTTAARGIVIAKGESLNAAELWGVMDVDDVLANPNVALTDFVAIGHQGGRDSFYEMSVPLSALGLTRAQLESQGLGVFINAGSTSSMDTIPHDPSTLNTHGATGSNSSLEWEDADSFTVPYARIGAGS